MREDLLKIVEQKYSKVYAQALNFSLNSEGQFMNKYNDKRGMRYAGISYSFTNKWKGWRIIEKHLSKFPELQTAWRKPPTSLARFNSILAEDTELWLLIVDFYYENYFRKITVIEGSYISEKLSIILFDMSVASGVKRAVKTLQRYLSRYYRCDLDINGVMSEGVIKALQSVLDSSDKIELIISDLLMEFVDNINEHNKISYESDLLRIGINRVINLRNYLRLLK